MITASSEEWNLGIGASEVRKKISNGIGFFVDVIKVEVGLVLSDAFNRSNYAWETPSCSVVEVVEQLNGAMANGEEFVRLPSINAAMIQSQEDSL